MTRVRPETVIEDDVVTVEPGQMAQTSLTVRNTGEQIAEYEVSLVPDCVASAWTQADPPSFRLLPGKDQRVLLRFNPPLDSSTPAGSFPYGVIVKPDEHHQAPAVAEGDIAIGAFHALAAELKPPQSRGRWRGKHVVKLHNQGTDDLRVKVSAPGDDEGLSYALAPTTLAIPPRTRAEAFLKVRPRSLKIMGKPADHAFEMTYRRRGDSRAAVGVPGTGVPEGGEVESQLQGSFTQKPLVSKLMLVVLGLLVVGAALLAVFRPWEKPEPKAAPDPLEDVQMVSHAQDAVVVSWNSPPNIDQVQIREVECSTASDVLPAEKELLEPIEMSGAGARHETLEGFTPGEAHCFQTRALQGDELSIWAPRPAFQVEVGNTVGSPAGVEPVHVGACKVDVDWTLVEPENDAVTYEVLLGEQAVGDPVTAGPVKSDELPPGESVDVVVQTIVEGFEPAASEPVTVDVPEDCEEQEEQPREAAEAEAAAEGEDEETGDEENGATTPDPGSEQLTDFSESESGRFWLLISQGEQRLEGQDFRIWETMWPVFGRHVGLWTPLSQQEVNTPDDLEGIEGIEDVQQPRLAIVGSDVLLPPRLQRVRGTQLGDEVLFVDLGYGDDREAAENDCADLNAFYEFFKELGMTGQPCVLVTPDGRTEPVRASGLDVDAKVPELVDAASAE